MTAFDTTDFKDNEDFKKAKIDRILQKPIHFADLRQMINESVISYSIQNNKDKKSMVLINYVYIIIVIA